MSVKNFVIIGSGCLVFPLVFEKAGIFTAIFVMVFVGLINYITCDYLLIHGREEE